MTAATSKYGGRKMREGTVVSHSMEKTVVVSVSSAIRHRLYKKTIRRNRNYIVHDENGEAHKGDRVRIVEAEPISKTKRWRLIEVLRQIELPDLAPEEIDLEVIGEVKPQEEEAPAALAETQAEQPAAEATDQATQPAAETTEEIEPPEEVKTAEDAPAEPEAPAAEEAAAASEEAGEESTEAEEPADAGIAAEEPTDEGKAE